MQGRGIFIFMCMICGILATECEPHLVYRSFFHADQGLPRYFQVEVTTTPQHIRLILMQRIQKKKKGFAQVARLVTEGIIHTPPR